VDRGAHSSSLQIPSSAREIPVHGDDSPVLQDQLGIAPGDGVSPPFVVYLPDFQDLLDLPNPSFQIEKGGAAPISHTDPEGSRDIQGMKGLGIELLQSVVLFKASA